MNRPPASFESPREGPMRVVDIVHCDEIMHSNMHRRREGDLAVSLPSPSFSPSSTFEPLTPRSFISRWLLSLQKPLSGGRGVVGCRVRFPRYRSKKRKDDDDFSKGEDEDVGEIVGPSLVDPTAVEAPPLVSVLAESRTPELSATTGKPAEVPLNLGLGASLVFLLVKSATELNKMIEIQEQMAVLLKDIKEDMRRKEVPSSFTESNSNLVYSDSNYCMKDSISNSTLSQNDNASHHLSGAHGGVESDRESKCGRTSKKKRGVKMNQLEVELEVELERLQLNMEGGRSYLLPRQHRPEFAAENSDPPESYNVSFVEAGEPKEEESSSRHYGVPPRELERRLHELLETRQQERIVELECALECAERKLREKDVEICWWRDTAKLVSKHKEETLFR